MAVLQTFIAWLDCLYKTHYTSDLSELSLLWQKIEVCLEPLSALLIALGKGCRKCMKGISPMGPWQRKCWMSEGTNTWIRSNWIHDLECHPSQRHCFWLGNFPHFQRLVKMSTWLRTAWTLAAISEPHAHKRSRPLKDLNFRFNFAMQMRPKTLFQHLVMCYKCKHYEEWKGDLTWHF